MALLCALALVCVMFGVFSVCLAFGVCGVCILWCIARLVYSCSCVCVRACSSVCVHACSSVCVHACSCVRCVHACCWFTDPSSFLNPMNTTFTSWLLVLTTLHSWYLQRPSPPSGGTHLCGHGNRRGVASRLLYWKVPFPLFLPFFWTRK